MNVAQYRFKNNLKRAKARLMHPPPIYKRGGSVGATVIRADGSKDELGIVADVWRKRWGVDK